MNDILTQETSYKRYLWVWAIIVLLGVLGVVTFNLIVDPFDIYQLVKWPGHNTKKIDYANHIRLEKAHAVERVKPMALVLGTSRSEFGLDPNHPGWDATATPRYNLSIPDANMYEVLRYFQHAVHIKKPKQVVFGVDFLMFNAFEKPEPDFDELRLDVQPDGTPNRQVSGDLTATLLSADAARASVITLLGQNSTGYSVFLPNGQREWTHNAEIIKRRGGHRHMFMYNERRFMTEVWFPMPTKSYKLRHPRTGYSALQDFRKMVEIARANNIDLRVLISPAHARLWEALKVAGLWPTFEQWKRELVAIIDSDAITNPDKSPIPLWDFSGANSLTTEAVPPYGDTKATMKWYWEASHYKKELGDLVLDRVFDYHDPQRKVPDDFGVRLTRANVEDALKVLRESQDYYRQSHPQDAAEIDKTAEDTQSARFCSEFLSEC